MTQRKSSILPSPSIHLVRQSDFRATGLVERMAGALALLLHDDSSELRCVHELVQPFSSSRRAKIRPGPRIWALSSPRIRENVSVRVESSMIAFSARVGRASLVGVELFLREHLGAAFEPGSRNHLWEVTRYLHDVTASAKSMESTDDPTREPAYEELMRRLRSIIQETRLAFPVRLTVHWPSEHGAAKVSTDFEIRSAQGILAQASVETETTFPVRSAIRAASRRLVRLASYSSSTALEQE